jgi:Rps23 Pro-64 3,4-dihydroxylase Tpa1-like proline 4-hydroxylase
VSQTWAVVDDFLGVQEHVDLWDAFQETIVSPARAQEWNRVYRRMDGEEIPSSEGRPRRASLQDVTVGGSMGPPAVRLFSDRLFALLTGDRPRLSLDPWTGFSLSAWVYRPGAGLEWHSDTGWLAGYIYYMHPVWRSSWGGELLVAADEAQPSLTAAATPSPPDEARTAEWACRAGGAFIYPRPNRLVLLRGGTWHCVKKVESAAGKAFRASLSGFLFSTDGSEAPV